MINLEDYEVELDLLMQAVKHNHPIEEITERTIEIERMAELIIPTLTRNEIDEHMAKIHKALRIMHMRYGVGTVH